MYRGLTVRILLWMLSALTKCFCMYCIAIFLYAIAFYSNFLCDSLWCFSGSVWHCFFISNLTFFLYPLMLLFTSFQHMLAHHGNKQQCADSCSIVLQICDTTLHFLTACSHYSIWLTSLPPKTCSLVILCLACTGKHRICAVIITVGNCFLEKKWRKDGEKRRRTEKYLNKPRILTLSSFSVRKISIHVHFVAVQFFCSISWPESLGVHS